MVAKERQRAANSSRVVVGEIDTRAPFQSVKDAVSLFGEGAFSGEKPTIKKARPQSAERVIAKETQLHVAHKELNKFKEQLKNAEITKSQALVELEKVKRAVEDLTYKIKTVNDLKDSSIVATEAAKNQAKLLEEANGGNPAGANDAWKHHLETTRENYITAITELDAAKQELRKLRQDCDASLAAKVTALKQAAEAESAAKANVDRASYISKEILVVQESIGQVKVASLQAQQDEAKIFSTKEIDRQSYRASLEASKKRSTDLKKELDPDTLNLENQLAETVTEIGVLQKQVENAKTSDSDSVRMVTLDLDGVKESLLKVAEEESSLRSLVEALKTELENVKKEHSELKEKEAETESIAGNLHVKLRKAKSELEALAAEESKVTGTSDEMISTLQQLSLERETAREEAKEMRINAEKLKKEAEATKIALEETEKDLRVAIEEAEEAKTAESNALDQIKILSESASAARASTSESGANIRISKDEFESLSRKVEESDKLTEMKVAAAMAQVEAVKACENEALKRLEVTQKEIEDMKSATKEALKRAEMAEAAKKAVEGELRRWREREQKKAAEAASRILAETEMSSETSPNNYRIQKQNPTQKIMEVQKLDKEKKSVSKKVLMSNLSGIFHRKKNQVEGGSPSYLPGEYQI